MLKPPGLSSHSVVNRIRKILNIKKVGHTGTLDPDAVGVLPICVGKATRLAEYLTADNKTYRAVIGFGSETDTQDATGNVTYEANLPNLSYGEFNEILQKFKGNIEQLPPMYSAIKKDGQPLYKLAREGIVVEREIRKVEIYNIDLFSYNNKQALINVSCSKGTYIRTLCQDIGRAAQSAAHMVFLLRTKSGIFNIEKSFTLDEISLLDPNEFLINPINCLDDFQEIVVEGKTRIDVLHGNKISIDNLDIPSISNNKYKIIDKENNLLAIANKKNNFIQPEKVFGDV
ncbi:tRNA pseudouridine55 synthase [Desulfonispora thiosulfatigenes DSM 11270]|uniref:tRNA pseudouridine synthase B n=1 Tax=Desulfonispora thiosulfatigenes DSM 11270 TaxID=656914 RepID=A0A1W1VLE0_DESTI|nr:tRNA pseudouridine(55) synthase TruB [Desulfonispora thiosulfatigenes]SMB94103.1 tRNA pseudouridine55 synthase [Desulfonispora thiosulfatigenes DSM 11270]